MSIRVAFVITALELGGAETMLFRLLSRLDRSVFAPMVISLADGGTLRSQFEEQVGKVVSLGVTARSISGRAIWRLVRVIRDFRPDLIQGWMPHGNLAGLVARMVASGRTALVWGVRQSVYDIGYEHPSTARLIRVSARVSSKPEAIVYNSRTARVHHEALGYSAKKGVIIPNGFDVSAFASACDDGSSLRHELGLPSTALLAGIVGRFHPMKDHRNFIEAAARVRYRYPECRFLMAGTGMSRDNIELVSCLRAAGLEEATSLLGSRQDIARVYSALDVAVSSSYTESFPNVIGEAMACGVPCVVTNVGDSALLVGDTGVVVPPRDPEALASGMRRVLELTSHERQALGAAARTRVAAEFSLEKAVASFASLYLSILSKRKG
jgi:glycosyltransferase involved in cell wall biosynthesis